MFVELADAADLSWLYTVAHNLIVNHDKKMHENELPLYTWLKEQKGFAGFDPAHPLTEILHNMFSQVDSAYAEKPDIKWNFTKFLIDREGNVVERFEPTATQEAMAPAIEKLL